MTSRVERWTSEDGAGGGEQCLWLGESARLTPVDMILPARPRRAKPLSAVFCTHLDLFFVPSVLSDMQSPTIDH